MERLHKYLADAGIASRRKSEELIKQGKIKVNGEIVKELGVKIDPENDKIEYEGKLINKNGNKINKANPTRGNNRSGIAILLQT